MRTMKYDRARVGARATFEMNGTLTDRKRNEKWVGAGTGTFMRRYKRFPR